MYGRQDCLASTQSLTEYKSLLVWAMNEPELLEPNPTLWPSHDCWLFFPHVTCHNALLPPVPLLPPRELALA